MKNLFLFALAVLLGAPALAQNPILNDTLIGGPQNEIEDFREQYRQMESYMNQQKWEDAYPLWAVLVRRAPLAACSYFYHTSEQMFQDLVSTEEDPQKRLEFYMEMLFMYDTRLANLDDLNRLYGPYTYSKNGVSTKGDVMIYRQFWRNELGPRAFEDNPDGYSFDKEAGYKKLKDAIQFVRKNGGHDVYPSALSKLSEMSSARFANDPQNTLADFLQDQMFVLQLSDSLIEEARQIQTDSAVVNARAKYILDYYQYPLQLAQVELNKSRSQANMDDVDRFFMDRVDKNRTNRDELLNILDIMSAANYIKLQAYTEAAQILYNQYSNRSYQVQLAMGLDALRTYGQTKDKADRSKAERMCNQAMEAAPDNNKRAAIAFMVAQAMFNGNEYPAARSYFQKAEDYAPRYRARRLIYNARMTRTEQMERFKNNPFDHDLVVAALNKAIEDCQAAVSADESQQSEAVFQINQTENKITYVKDYWARNGANLIKQRAKYEKEIKAWKKAQAEKQAEEDFWNKGRGK